MQTKLYYIIISIVFATICVGCKNNNTASHTSLPEEVIEVKYAQGFRAYQGNGYQRYEIINPWDTTRLLRCYILIDINDTIPSELPQGTIVRTPVTNTLVFSSVHCSLLQELNRLDAIGGICDSEYVYIEELQQRLKTGQLVDAGNSTTPDIEQVIALNPDAILLSPFENIRHERLEKTNIPIIECADYMETSPLGRVEWLHFFGQLYGCQQVADSLFEAIEETYLNTCQQVSQIPHRPRVITERRIGSVWYIPGGKSYMAQLINDAGGEYPWNDNNNTGSLPLSFENVLERGQDADFWLIKYHSPKDFTYNTLKEEYTPNTRFKAFKEQHIYGCNTQYHRYYEETPFHPDRLLQDLVAIFHPQILDDYTPYYYSPLAQ